MDKSAIYLIIKVFAIILLVSFLFSLLPGVGHQTFNGKIHTHYKVVGDFIFEATSEPDNNGNFNVIVTNTKREVFKYEQIFNDYDALIRDARSSLNYFPSQNTYKYNVSLNKKSGFTFLSDKSYNNLNPYTNQPFDAFFPVVFSDQLFKSASNFFDIY
jgi:hypothetical protein